MYRDAELDCPACNARLAPVRSALPAMGCAGCGGMWLGPDATVHVMRGLGDALEREVDHAARDVARDAKAPSVPDDSRVCPQCAQPFTRTRVERVELDTCFTHGTFFDAREVAEVLRICGDLRRAQTGDIGREVGDDGGDLWGRFVRLLGGD